MNTYRFEGQDPTEVVVNDEKQVVITQYDYNGEEQVITIDPLFMPTLIKWLQEAAAIAKMPLNQLG